MASIAREIRDRFWSNVDSSGGPDSCWLWQGPMHPGGYGQAWDGRRAIGAHRLAYLITKGAISSGLVILHACDNRRCVNPAHLSTGTQRENMRDKVAKGRQGRGWAISPGGKALSIRLTPEKYARLAALAKQERRSMEGQALALLDVMVQRNKL